MQTAAVESLTERKLRMEHTEKVYQSQSHCRGYSCTSLWHTVSDRTRQHVGELANCGQYAAECIACVSCACACLKGTSPLHHRRATFVCRDMAVFSVEHQVRLQF